MRNNLATRIEALEALPASVVSLSDNPLEKARRDKAMQALAERIADPHKAQREYAALSAAGRIDHWQGKITEAKAIIARGDAGIEDTPGVVPGILRSMQRLTLVGAKDGVESSYQFGLIAAQLDRLAELGYNGAKLKEWNEVCKRFDGIPWQWRKDCLVLPADALALLKQKEAAK